MRKPEATRERGRWLPLRTAMLLLAVLWCGVSRGQNVVTMGFGQGEPGDLGIPVIITARNDLPVHGYSIALSFPAEAIEVSSLSVEGTHVAGLNPEFVAPQIDNELGVATLGVIFNFTVPIGSKSMNPVPPGGFPQIIARLVVNVKPDAAGGSYPLRLVEGIGSPAIFNRFSVAGTSVVPTLEDGEFVVRGRNVLLLEKKRAIGGALVPSLQTIAFAQHVDALTGYSIAILYDCVALELVEATHVNTDVFAQLGQPNRIEFFLTDVDDTIGGNACRSRTGVIFDFVAPFEGQALQPAPDAPTQSLMRYRWRVNPIANNGTEFQELVLDDRIGDISNDFLVGSDSIQPRRINGKIYFSTGTIVGQVVDIRTGGPVSGARVVTDPGEREALTVINGAFAIEDVIPGTYRLRIEKAGIYPARTDVVQVRGQNVAENVGQIGVYSVPGQRVTFRRALINADGRSDISDGVWLLNWLFKGGPLPVCMQAADVNDDNRTDISDAIYFLNFLFNGGPQPNEPYVNCGTDEADLSCENPPGCL